MKVHILATDKCDMVFRTIRVGFPGAEICVYDNTDEHTTHGEWISQLVDQQGEPFWICDTDIVFWSRIPAQVCPALNGRLMPSYRCPITKLRTAPRIHPSLMLIDPNYFRKPRTTQYNPCIDIWEPKTIPTESGWVFHDTGALAYKIAVNICEVFDSEVNKCFDHLFLGSHPQTVISQFSEEIQANRALAIANPALLRGVWPRQLEWFRAQQ